MSQRPPSGIIGVSLRLIRADQEAPTSSMAAYRLLEGRGYQNVRRYASGLNDWEAAGYPLEGEMVEQQ